MPATPLPTDLPAALDRIHALEVENEGLKTELKVRSESSVSSFVDRNQKLILTFMVAILTALGGGNFVASYLNREKITEVRSHQDTIKESVTDKVSEVGAKVDDVKREVKVNKGPFE